VNGQKRECTTRERPETVTMASTDEHAGRALACAALKKLQIFAITANICSTAYICSRIREMRRACPQRDQIYDARVVFDAISWRIKLSIPKTKYADL